MYKSITQADQNDKRISKSIRRFGSVKKFVFLVKNGSFLVRIQI